MARQFHILRTLPPFSVKRLAASLLTLFCAAFPLMAQDTGRGETTVDDWEERGEMDGEHLGISLRAGMGSWRDDLLVPLGFDGPGVSLGGIFSSRTDENLIRARLNLSAAYLKNRFSHEALVLACELRPSWTKKFAGNRNLGWFWGGISLPMQINDLYLGSWDDAHIYWLTSYALAPAIEWQKSLFDRNDLALRLEAPVVSLVSRPPSYRHNKQDALTRWTFYFDEPQRALHIESLGSYQALFFQAFLRRSIGSSLLNLGVEFEYAHLSEPEDLWGMNSSVILSYQWRIGR